MKRVALNVQSELGASSAQQVENVTVELAGLGILRARTKFRGRLQRDAESCERYANALEALAVRCNFTSGILEELIRDQFIFGIKSKAMQDHLLCDERDGNMSLKDAVSIASAGEAFQIMRFGNQHPLEKTEIQDLVGPHLDENSLLTMHTVSTSCRSIAKRELGKPERRILRKARWVPFPLWDFEETEEYDLDRFFGTYNILHFQEEEIQRFINYFGAEGGSARSSIGFPIFGEDIVRFEFREERLNEAIVQERYNTTLKFFQLFGTQVKVLIWENVCSEDYYSELKGILRYTPNLRDLWLPKYATQVHNFLEDVEGWPELPYLDSIHFNFCFYLSEIDGRDFEEQHEPLIRAYGSQLTALETSYLNLNLLLSKCPAELLPLSNVQDLTVDNCVVHHDREILECAVWRLKRLAIIYNNKKCYPELILSQFMGSDGKLINTRVKKANFIWSLINQSSESLEELYLGYYCHWDLFVLFFLMPVLQNPDHKNSTKRCKKFRKLVIPSMYLMRVKQLSQVICTRFPNLEHIELADWGKGNRRNYKKNQVTRMKNDSSLHASAKDWFFSFDYAFPIPMAQLSDEILIHFWEGLSSLKKISVREYDNPQNVVFKQIRSSKDRMIITTISD